MAETEEAVAVALELNEMQVLFFQKYGNAVKLFAPFLPADFPIDPRQQTFASLLAAIGTYLMPIKRFIVDRDAEYLFGLAEAASTEFAIRDIYTDQLNDEQRDKLWRYLEFFIDWYGEFTNSQ
jgi:hypothetical protein